MNYDHPDRHLDIKIVLEELSGSKLLRDYQATEPQALGFYAGDWKKLESYRHIANEIDKKFDKVARERALDTFRLPEGFSEERCDSWVNECGLVVSTGQQPGLLGGPLYTLYKALSAIQLASRLENTLSRVVIPVFWIASEDHDWEEVNQTYFIDREDHVVKVALENEDHSGRSIHRVLLSSEISRLIDEVSQGIGEKGFRDDCMKLFRECYREGTDLGSALGEMLLKVLGPKGLVILDSNNTTLKSHSRELLITELEHAQSTEIRLKNWNDSLSERGYELQVPILDKAVNLFMESNEGRERIYRDGDVFVLRKSGRILTLEQIEELSGKDLSILSPNVLLRPIVEASVLPVVSYVAGPGELAYYAQLKPLYEIHGINMPILYPRHSATLIETKIQRKMSKLGLSLEDCERPAQDIFSSIARGEISDSINVVIDKLKAQIEEHSDDLLVQVSKFDSTLQGSVTKSRNTSLAGIDGLNRKIIRSFKRKNEETLNQVETVRSHLFPNGNRQERVLNPFFYLARYGELLIEELISSFEVELTDEEDRG
jgi:bacillithiol biosynthesis cysteine-adding enzyme BshC